MIHCKKGQPQEICHDNGGNFMGRERIMRSCKTLESPTDSWISATEMNGVDIQYTSWFPPWWSVGVLHTNSKESLYSTSKGLLTLMCEVASIINGRPMAKSSDDPRDYSPNHVLLSSVPVRLWKRTSIPADGISCRALRMCFGAVASVSTCPPHIKDRTATSP